VRTAELHKLLGLTIAGVKDVSLQTESGWKHRRAAGRDEGQLAMLPGIPKTGANPKHTGMCAVKYMSFSLFKGPMGIFQAF
jgi:hypothetical protein